MALHTFHDATVFAVSTLTDEDWDAIRAYPRNEIRWRRRMLVANVSSELVRNSTKDLWLDCMRIEIERQVARIASDPALARAARAFEPLRPPLSQDDFLWTLLEAVLDACYERTALDRSD